jgi:two-component system, sensor histidine kinase PdtaS
LDTASVPVDAGDLDAFDPGAQFRLALEAAPTGMLMVDSLGRIAFVNSQVEKLFGYSRHELIGMPVELLVPGRFRARHPEFRDSFLASPQARAMGGGRELYALRKDGTELPVEIGLTPLKTSSGMLVLSSIVDVTERKRSVVALRERTEELSARLKERDVLLQEIHHRVKNTLQVISSLISMQIRKLDSNVAVDELRECKTRVEAIGLIHAALYQSRDYARVPFSDYARQLAANVLHASDALGRIELVTDMDKISLAVDKAIPCGLILNEAITNATRSYADGRRGKIKVSLKRADAHRIRLAVSHDGPGIQSSDSHARQGSMGWQLITTLSEQLEGELKVVPGESTTVQVEFPVSEA